jgi:hypothetical protein
VVHYSLCFDDGNAWFASCSPRLPACIKGEQSPFWSRDLKDLVKPKWDDMKVLGAKHLYAVEDLGHGENGRVWLMATSSGYIYVLIIPRSMGISVDDECKNWNIIYPEFKPLLHVCSGRMLLGPYDAENATFRGHCGERSPLVSHSHRNDGVSTTNSMIRVGCTSMSSGGTSDSTLAPMARQ